MAETTLVINHINILKTLISQLIMLGHKIKEIERVELLLQSLPDSYDQLIINLTNNNLMEYLIFNDVLNSILENIVGVRAQKTDKQVRSKRKVLTIMRG